MQVARLLAKEEMNMKDTLLPSHLNSNYKQHPVSHFQIRKNFKLLCYVEAKKLKHAFTWTGIKNCDKHITQLDSL